MAPRQELALNQALSAEFAPNLSVLIHLVHLIFIWQCPSGTANGYNILQINSFSLHPVFQRTSGLRIKESVEFWLISVSILWGQAPQKLLTNFLNFSEKNSKSKKMENYFFDFGSKNYADRCILVSGVREKSFVDQKPILKIFDFGLRKFSKNFWKIYKIFSIFFAKFFTFLHLFCKFL